MRHIASAWLSCIALLVGVGNGAVASADDIGSDSTTPVQVSFVAPLQLFSKETRVYGIRCNLIAGKNAYVYGLDFGLVGISTEEVFGVQLGAVNAAAHCNALQISPFYNGATRGGNAIQIGMYNDLQGDMQDAVAGTSYGLQIGVMNAVGWAITDSRPLGAGLYEVTESHNTQADFNGVQVGYFGNCVGGTMTGLQANAAINFVYGSLHGVQIAPLANVTHGKESYGLQACGIINVGGSMKGVQISCANMDDDFQGIQIGAFNMCKRLKGVQIGAINIVTQGPIPFFPGVNIGF